MSVNLPSLMRDFLRPELPLLPGQYPSRPAPGHILNNFVVHALGPGAKGSSLAKLVGSGEGVEEIFNDASSAGDREAALRLVKTIYNSDGNVYRNFSSPFLTSPDFARADPSDDGYAMALWRSIGAENRAALTAVMSEVFIVGDATDIVSKLSQVLIANLESAAPSKSRPLPADEGTPFGLEAGKILVQGLEKMRTGSDRASRLEYLRRTSIMLAGLVILGMLYDPVVAALAREESDPPGQDRMSPGDALGVFVYTGETPGLPQNSLVGLAVRSLDDAVLRAHDGYASTFERVLRGEMKSSRRRSKDDQLTSAVTARMQGEEAKRFLSSLRSQNAATSPAEFARTSIDLTRLRSSVKSLGYKVGLSAPQRQGSLRLVLETNFLTSLTFFLGREDMDVQDFVDEVYERLGLVIGEPMGITAECYERLVQVAGRAYDVEQSLTDGQELLRRRLIRSGLAREYSDGFTLLGEQ